LLEPTRAVGRLRTEALRTMRSVDRRIRLMAAVQWSVIGRRSQGQIAKEEIVAAIYRTVPTHALAINQWTRELEESALRSIEGGETRVAIAAIDSLALIGREYLVRRRHTLTPILVNALGVYDSNLRDVLTPIYESLTRAALRAIATKNEPIVIRVVEGLGGLALTSAALKSRVFRPEQAPLTALPIGYLERCVRAALAAGLHDTGLEASRALANVSVGAPKDTDLVDAHISVADGILRIAAGFLTRQQTALANLCVDDCLRSQWAVVTSRHFQADHYAQHMLRELAGLIPVAVVIESGTGWNAMTTPLGPVYDLSNRLALGYLLASVAHPDAEDGRSPYRYFSKLSEVFYRHLRYVAEDVDLKESSLTWHIVKSIGHMSQVYAELVGSAPTGQLDAARALAKAQLPWYLAFHWVYFSKAKSIHLQTANEATSSLASIAFTYVSLSIPEVVNSAIHNIGSITRAYGKLGQLHSQYDIGDLLRPLLCLERFAIATGDQALIQEIDGEVDGVVDLFQGDMRAAVGEAVDVRRSQVEDALADPWNGLLDWDNPERLLARMLSERGLL
jgi:hypothetical protein